MIERPVSTGRQEFGTNKDNWPLTEPIIKIGALDQTSGMTDEMLHNVYLYKFANDKDVNQLWY